MHMTLSILRKLVAVLRKLVVMQVLGARSGTDNSAALHDSVLPWICRQLMYLLAISQCQCTSCNDGTKLCAVQ